MRKINKNLLSVLIILILAFLFVGCSASTTKSVPNNPMPESPKDPFAIIDTVKEYKLPVNAKQSDYYVFNLSDWEAVKDASPLYTKANITWYEEKSQSNEFEISSEEDLRGLAWLVNNNIDDFRGKTITLKNNIELTEAWIPIGEGSPEYTLGNYEKNNALGFSGKAVPTTWEKNENVVYRFCGIFDGNGKTISNLTNLGTGGINNAYATPSLSKVIDKNQTWTDTKANRGGIAYGLFGMVQGTQNNEGIIVGDIIKNLNLDNVKIEFGQPLTSSISDEEYAELIQYVFVSSMGSVVGAGINNILLENINIEEGYVNRRASGVNPTLHAGGIAGDFYSKFLTEPANGSISLIMVNNCKNKNVEVNCLNGYVGGIFGYIKGEYYSELYVYDSTNEATIGNILSTAEKSITGYSGGIIGYTSQLGRVVLVGLNNKAEIKATNAAGGIIGYCSGKSIINSEPSVIMECYNEGNISTWSSSNVGGIAGYFGLYRDNHDRTMVGLDLRSIGNIIGANYYAGGLFGQVDYFHTANFKDCSVGSKEKNIFVEVDSCYPEYRKQMGSGGLFGLFDRGVVLNLTNIEICLKNLELAVPNQEYPCANGLVIGSLYAKNNTNPRTYYNFKNVKVYVENVTEDQVSQIRTLGNKQKKTEDIIYGQFFTEDGVSTLNFDDACTVTYLNISKDEGESESNRVVKLSEIKYEAVPNPEPEPEQSST